MKITYKMIGGFVGLLLPFTQVLAETTPKERRFRNYQVFSYDTPLIYQSDIATTGFDKLNLSEDSNYALPAPTPKRIRIEEAPGLSGTKAIRFFVPRAPNSYRAEVSLPHEKGFQERWYGERMLVPKDWVIDSGRAADIVIQWHAIPGNWRATHPNLVIAIQDDGWWVRQHYGNAQEKPARTNTRLKTPLEPGKWVDWVVHARWSPKADGLVEIWKDGVSVYKVEGPNVYSTIGIEYTPYLKTGIYHPEWNLNEPRKQAAFEKEQPAAHSKMIYISEMKVGSAEATYEDVASKPMKKRK